MIKTRAKIIVGVALTAVAVTIGFVKPAFLARPVLAKPTFMDRYNRDRYAKPELIGKCTVCHVSRGGNERNDFGEAFENAGYRITPKLRAKFPTLFEEQPNSDNERPAEQNRAQ